MIDTRKLNDLRLAPGEREGERGVATRVRRGALAALVVALCAATGLGATRFWPTHAVPTPALRAATARAPGSVPDGGGTLLHATGYVTARRQATVSAQITGTLTEVLVEEGARVQKGQVIARLDGASVQAALNIAQANVQSAQATASQAKAQLAQAESDLRRQAELAASGMVSKQAVEHARTAADSAAAQVDVRLREIEAARASYARAQVDAGYTQVRAPFAGVVTVKAAQVGEIVSPLSAGGFTRTGVCTIVDMESLELEVDVNESNIAQIKPEMPVQAVLAAYPDWKIPAHVIAVGPTADKGKATVKVRIALEQKDPRLVPDLGVSVSFLGARPPPDKLADAGGTLVPTEAVAQRNGKSVVFVVVDGKARLRSVRPGRDAPGSMLRLPDGVATGDRVVLSPPPSLHDGDTVAFQADPT